VLLGAADVPDLFKQLLEVVGSRRVLQALDIDDMTLDGVLRENARRPLPEFRRSLGAYAIADGNDGVQVVVEHLALNLAAPLEANL
jgi:hypothetical protein